MKTPHDTEEIDAWINIATEHQGEIQQLVADRAELVDALKNLHSASLSGNMNSLYQARADALELLTRMEATPKQEQQAQ